MTLRDKRQAEFAKTWVATGTFGILYLCPRFGKCRTAIHALKEMSDDREIIIAYPDEKIKRAWLEDFEYLKFDDSNVTYTTHLSLKKMKGKKDCVLIIDEIHLLSEAQIDVVKELIIDNPIVLGLTGTLSKWTAKDLLEALKLKVVARYTIEQAIKEGVITDYQINVIKVELDNSIQQKFGKKTNTEKKQYNNYTFVINKMEGQGKDTMFLRLVRKRIVQNSIAKRNKTKSLITKFRDQRVLIFCGTTGIADSLGIPSFHNKTKDKELFEKFAKGEGNHLAVVKIGNTGTTYLPLNMVVINDFDSNSENLTQKINRCMAMEYQNPDKKAYIYIITSTEEAELIRLRSALEFFDKSKILYT